MTLKIVDPEAAKDWNMIVRFPDQSQSFCNGFEAGRIFHQLENNQLISDEENMLTVRTENISLYESIAKHFKYDCHHKVTEYAEWTYVWFIKKPSGLKLV